ncbi:hypothetical protein BGZ46_004652, partial [Entomortierella lignicola]
QDLDVHPFFLNNGVPDWTVEKFLDEHPSDLKRYCSSLETIESHKSVARSIRNFCFKQLEFLASFEGSTHVDVIKAQSRTSQNSLLIKENSLDGLQRGIIAEQKAKLESARLSTVCPSTEAPSTKQPNEQEIGNAGQGKADDSGT